MVPMTNQPVTTGAECELCASTNELRIIATMMDDYPTILTTCDRCAAFQASEDRIAAEMIRESRDILPRLERALAVLERELLAAETAGRNAEFERGGIRGFGRVAFELGRIGHWQD